MLILKIKPFRSQVKGKHSIGREFHWRYWYLHMWLPTYLSKNKPKRLQKWVSNTQKIRTAYTKIMETKRQNIDTGNANEPQYVCTQNGTAKTTISKKEEKYTSNLKGTKLTILKKTEKNLLKIVNVYAPHCETTNKNPEITVNFYNDLNNLLNQINNKSSIVLVAGNFNGETGKKTDIDKCLGDFFGGRRNQKGQHLINLCTNHDLLITNACFRHKEKRLITWEQTHIV